MSQVTRASAEGIDLPLACADGRTLVLPDVGIAVVAEQGDVQRVVLEVTVGFDVYQAIVDAPLFHLEPEHRGPSMASFDERREVELELALDPSQVARLVRDGVGNAAQAIGTLMRLAREDDEHEPILRAGCWYALHAKQVRDDGLKVGYATSWTQSLDQMPVS